MRIITENQEIITIAEQCDMEIQKIPMSQCLKLAAYICFADKAEYKSFRDIVESVNPEAAKELAA